MKRQRSVRRFLGDETASTIVEFAVVSVIFFTLICGIIEYGLIQMTKIAIESATEQTSRSTGIDATVTGCLSTDRVCQVRALIAQKTLGIINPNAVLVTAKVITAPTDLPPPQPDVCVPTSPSNPYPATCPGAFIDNNGNGIYDANVINTGTTNDLVQISVFYQWQVMFPLMKPFFPGGVVNMTSTTVVKNEPF